MGSDGRRLGVVDLCLGVRRLAFLVSPSGPGKTAGSDVVGRSTSASVPRSMSTTPVP
jgi:hypothetical protein